MASVVDTSVKVFKSSQLGAPVLSGTAGALIAVLDACLVNGWGLKTLDSLVINNNVATMNIASGHSFIIGSVALITGATPAALNGEQRITSITGNSASFAVAGLTNQTATGAITAKIAPAGWDRPFSGTNLAAYKSSDPQSAGSMLRVNDTGTTTARVVGYEVMTDVNTGTSLFPTVVQNSNNLYWSKSDTTSSSSREWAIYADSRGFLFCPQFQRSNGFFQYAFGEIIATKPNDAFSTFLSGDIYQSPDQPYTSLTPLTWSSIAPQNGHVLARSYTGLGGAIAVVRTAFGFLSNSSFWSGVSGLVYPNSSNGGLYISPLNIIEGVVHRGVMFGIYLIPQVVPAGAFSHFDRITNVSSMQGRTLEVVNLGANSYPYAIDVTGPWR